jgi:Domain of unknown function (DUF4349)
MRIRSWLVAVVAVGSAAVVLGCSSNDDSASFDETGAAVDASPEGSHRAEGGGSESDDEGGLALPAGEPIQPGRSIIATADVTIEVDDVATAAAQAGDVAASAGGFLAQQESLPEEGVVTLTLRVPTDQFQAAMGRIEALGAVLEQRIDTQDVTEQVVDLESRIASARVSVARVRELLEGSGDVVQLATVEGELARREADLESLLGRQRVLDDQVALATIRLDLREPDAEESDDAALPGFLGGLRRGWDGFVTTASVLVTGLGYALPFLMVVAVAVGTWVLVRRHRARPAGEAVG